MKKFFLPALLVILFALAGCGGSSSEPTNSSTVSNDSTDNVDDVFIRVVREQMPEEGISDYQLIDLGHNICTALDGGMSPVDVAIIGVRAGMSPYNSGFIIGASVVAYCPRHRDLIE